MSKEKRKLTQEGAAIIRFFELYRNSRRHVIINWEHLKEMHINLEDLAGGKSVVGQLVWTSESEMPKDQKAFIELYETVVFNNGEYSYRIPINGYSDWIDGMSKVDATRYITSNESLFFNEFSERAGAAGLDDEQIMGAFCAMRSGDYTQMASYFDTSSPVDGAVFWSGDKEAATAYANSIGGTVLEQTQGGQVFDEWRGLAGMYPAEWGSGGALDRQPIWKALSTQYANGASGYVTYVHPSGCVGKMWEKTELLIIQKKRKAGIVTEIKGVCTDGK